MYKFIANIGSTYFDHPASWLISGEFDTIPIQPLIHVHLLFCSQNGVDKELLYPLIAVVDTELLKAILSTILL